jgi:hypothetical protein
MKIPVNIGNLTALIEKPEPPRCCVPGCHGEFWTSCEYPVGRNGHDHTCDARLCEGHVVKWGTLKICPSHWRLIAMTKLTVQRGEIR